MDDTRECELEARRAGFSVDMNDEGRWVVRECSGLIEGEFETQGEALRFALSELGRGRMYPAGQERRLQLATHESND